MGYAPPSIIWLGKPQMLCQIPKAVEVGIVWQSRQNPHHCKNTSHGVGSKGGELQRKRESSQRVAQMGMNRMLGETWAVRAILEGLRNGEYLSGYKRKCDSCNKKRQRPCLDCVRVLVFCRRKNL